MKKFRYQNPDWLPNRKRSKDGAGYIRLTGQWGHPNAGSNGRIMEHVLVMSLMLHRGLLSHENVHHKNGQRDDNRPENLELWSTSQPQGQRVADKIHWANEIIEIYGRDPQLYEVTSGKAI